MHRIFSLTGVLPLGVFLVLHVMANGRALVSDVAFGDTMRRVRGTPGIFAIELVLVFLPLLFHAVVGAYLIAARRTLEPSVLAPALRAVHRAAGMIAFAFIAYHLYEYRLHLAVPGLREGDYYTALSSRLSSTTAGAPLRAMFYVLGIAAVALHFAVGLWGFVVARGWFVAPRARLLAGAGAGVVGLALFVGAANVVTFFATGAKIFGRTEMTPLATDPTPCPAPSGAASH